MNPSGVRDRALLLVLATTGLRNTELRSPELQDIHWRAAEVLVRRRAGSGRSTRRVCAACQAQGSKVSGFSSKWRLVRQQRPINEAGHQSIGTTAIICEGGVAATRRCCSAVSGRRIMSFCQALADRVEGYIVVRRSLGYAGKK
jgi:hypothetical protein